MAEDKELAEEGMLYVGDKGKILGGFRSENPQLIPEAKMREYRRSKGMPASAEPKAKVRGQGMREAPWIATFKGGPPTYGNFLLGGPISDFVNLAAISLRLGGNRLLWDAANAKITNVADANKYLTRQYRRGWELNGA